MKGWLPMSRYVVWSENEANKPFEQGTEANLAWYQCPQSSACMRHLLQLVVYVVADKLV